MTPFSHQPMDFLPSPSQPRVLLSVNETNFQFSKQIDSFHMTKLAKFMFRQYSLVHYIAKLTVRFLEIKDISKICDMQGRRKINTLQGTPNGRS